MLRDRRPNVAAIQIVRMMTMAGAESRAVAIQNTKQRAHTINGIKHLVLEWIAATTITALATLALPDPCHFPLRLRISTAWLAASLSCPSN